MFQGIPLIPISDLIIICFTAPIFSVILEAVFLKKRITLVSLVLCCLVVIGNILVVKPNFIFSVSSETDGSDEKPDNSTESGEIEMDNQYNNYTLGASVALYCAAVAALGKGDDPIIIFQLKT